MLLTMDEIFGSNNKYVYVFTPKAALCSCGGKDYCMECILKNPLEIAYYTVEIFDNHGGCKTVRADSVSELLEIIHYAEATR